MAAKLTATAHRPPLAPELDYTGPKRALILAGGGMRVAYHAGVLRALAEAGLVFTHVDGTSGGIINTGMVLSGLPPVEMCDRWRTLALKDAISPMPFSEYLKGDHMMAMCDADGIRRKMFPHLGIDIDRINSATGITKHSMFVTSLVRSMKLFHMSGWTST